MQILVAEYCTNVYYLSLARGKCSDKYRAFLGSQRVEGAASGARTCSIDPQAPGNSQTIIVQESVWSQKQNCSIKCGMSYASNT